MTYRDNVEALAARQADLSREVAHKARELADATRLLEDARARMHLPVLDNIRVASPCNASWAGMTGDDRVRHCGSCNKNVFNLSELTREQAESLITENNGKLCVRYFRRSDGTILAGDDCQVGTRRKRTRIALIAGATAAALGSTAFAVQSMHAPDGPAQWEQGEIEVGQWETGRIAVTPQPLDDRGIADGMATVQPLLLECAKKFPAHGNLQLDIHVAPIGSIDEVTVAHSLTDRFDLEACLVSAMHKATFRQSPSGAVFVYPLTF
jgi:hypothetical protein